MPSQDIKFRPDNEFRLVRDEEGIRFNHRSGRDVRTDRLGAAVWGGCPGTSAQIRERVREELAVSDELVDRMIHLFRAAGILRPGLPSRKPAPPSGRPVVEISIVIVTYNGEDHIAGCLDSIRRQSVAPREILVVDNASRDRTSAVVRDGYPEARWIPLPRNRHYAGAVNQGLRRAAGEAVLVLNQDLELDPDCLFRLAERRKTAGRAGALAPMMKFFHLRGFINGIGNQIRNAGWGSDNFIGCVDMGQFADLDELPSACFGAVLLDREAVKEVGFLDEGYGSYYEDVDWSLRCWLRGRRVAAAPGAVVYHKFGASYGESPGKLRFTARNRLRLVMKLFPVRLLYGFLRRYVKEDLKNCLSLMKKGRRDQALAYPRAYVSLLLTLPAVLIKRPARARPRLGGIPVRKILEKNPENFHFLIQNGSPVVDAGAVFGYYRWQYDKKRSEGMG